MMIDRSVRGLLAGRAVRVMLVEATGLAVETAVRHGLDAEASRVAAEAMLAALLLSAHIKGEERLTILLHGTEPELDVVCEVDSEGQLRARITPTTLPDGAGDALSGTILSVKSDTRRELYRGASQVVHETVESALRRHVANSTQSDVMVRLGVQLEEGRIVRAEGALVERLPAEPGLPSLERDEFHELFDAFEHGEGLEVIERVAEDPELEVLEQRGLLWVCRCSLEKVEAMLVALGKTDLEELIEEGHASVTCHFCAEERRVPAGRLRELLQIARR